MHWQHSLKWDGCSSSTFLLATNQQQQQKQKLAALYKKGWLFHLEIPSDHNQ
jgi:hypothetical protein